MYGYTGTWQGHPVSVQGSGMGQPSLSIYVNELFREYDVQSIVRVGSCGGADRASWRCATWSSRRARAPTRR